MVLTCIILCSININNCFIHYSTACNQGAIRLIGGTDDREGRVEVCNQNQWGSVCDVSWDMNDANVACRQAGFGSGNLNILMNAQKFKVSF